MSDIPHQTIIYYFMSHQRLVGLKHKGEESKKTNFGCMGQQIQGLLCFRLG